MLKPRRSPRRPGAVGLARALSKLGAMSRGEAVRRVLAVDVRVDGHVVRDPGRAVVPERAKILVAGMPVSRADPVTVVLNKPRGVVTTRSDPRGRPTVYSLLEGLGTWVAPVGRLDLASTGLLLLTNDTRLADFLLDPVHAVPRTYIVTVRGEVSDSTARRIERGIEDEGERLSARSVEVLKRSGRESHARIELVEGRNRELRRLFAACGHEVTRLKRIAFGGLALGDLQPGAWRRVSEEELRAAFPGRRERTAPSPSRRSDQPR